MEGMVEQLASLLLPIDALLNHSDFDSSPDSPSNIVTLFRNMWFLCVLFQFTTPSDQKLQSAMDWQQPALARIAMKTPPLVLEEAQDTIVSDLEYNTVIRQEYIETVVYTSVGCVLHPNHVSPTGHLETSCCADEAYTCSSRRNSLPAAWPGHLLVVHARHGEHAISNGTSIFPSDILREQWSE